ncbi:hypothetical protein BLNAU_7061 [Blattamonas nauphoetae]|uniref:Uncharacterized protein n=1 Tax=Blattamonas nauphoetae TaxID=2049346 RepID=A0ABQ9Y2A9_9EUKA|nr:hypothetical protein BLNAU_7061 [Blattamonas nauphoetae]
MSSNIASSSDESEQTQSVSFASFMDWDGDRIRSKSNILSICRSLISIVEAGHSIDDTLEWKADSLLGQYWGIEEEDETDQFILGLVPSPTDEPVSRFVTSIIALLATNNKIIVSATMPVLFNLVSNCSSKMHLNLVKADLTPRLITQLNPLFLSFTDSQEIHSCLTYIIASSIWLASQDGQTNLQIQDWNEQQAIHETVLQHVLIPAQPYLRHMCINYISITDLGQSLNFTRILGKLLRICPFHQPTLDLVQTLPVYTAMTNALTSFVNSTSIWNIFFEMIAALQEWKEHGGTIHQTGMTVHRCLRSEGLEDSIQPRLRKDED